MAITGPIAPYSNVPIQADYYQPRRFEINNISIGVTTTVTTSEDHDYVVGQSVRLIIPVLYGITQLNGKQGMVISIPSATEVELDIDSSSYNAFISSPRIASITGASKAFPCVLTANNSFYPGQSVLITDVGGMTELNDNIYSVYAATSTTISLNVDSSAFTTYSSGGTATLFSTNTNVPQITSIGDFNSGLINSDGRSDLGTFVPGSFINISPL